VLALALSLASGARAESLQGHIILSERGERISDVSGAIAYYVPDGGVAPPAPVTVTIETRSRRFAPSVLAVPVGSTVWFPNGDPIRHNVFSVSPGNRFDLGLYGTGKGRAQRFGSAGLARVFCNVHRTMSAFVLVLETPHYAASKAEGNFELAGLPPGRGVLHVWHPRCEPWGRAVEVPAREPVVVALEATLPLIPPHLDKFGQPYREDADGERYR
jgi:plastocyanin